MKEYERLTETKKINEYCSTVECGEHCEDCYAGKLYERLAELEDKIERGELVENTVVTYINMARSGSKTLVDKALKYDELKAKIENGTLIELPCMHKTVFGYYRVTFFSKMFNCIDSELFFNKAEAEKKLKELQGE